MVNLFVVKTAVVIFDDLFAHDRFDDVGGAVGRLRAALAEKFSDHFADEHDPYRERHDRRIDDERQERALHEHEHRHHDDFDDIENKIHQVVGEKIG